MLWHYTDAHGFFGIITSSQLRFADARFLNDRTERRFGERLFEQVLTEMVAADSKRFSPQFQNLLRGMRLPDRLLVCSMSAAAIESISQWQRYGADGAGYCIGFHPAKLDAYLDAHAFRKSMIYDEDEQLALLRSALERSVTEFHRLEEEKRRRRVTYIDYVFSDIHIDSALLQIKHPLFYDEHEWRYILRRADDDPSPYDNDAEKESYAVRGGYVKPFVQLPEPISTDGNLAIESVICGPRLDGELAVSTTRRFLLAHGYEVEVTHSPLAEIWR